MVVEAVVCRPCYLRSCGAFQAGAALLFLRSAPVPGFPGQAWHQDEDYIPTRDGSLGMLKGCRRPDGVNLEDVKPQLLTQALERAGGTQAGRLSCLVSTATRLATTSRSVA